MGARASACVCVLLLHPCIVPRCLIMRRECCQYSGLLPLARTGHKPLLLALVKGAKAGSSPLTAACFGSVVARHHIGKAAGGRVHGGTGLWS